MMFVFVFVLDVKETKANAYCLDQRQKTKKKMTRFSSVID